MQGKVGRCFDIARPMDEPAVVVGEKVLKGLTS